MEHTGLFRREASNVGFAGSVFTAAQGNDSRKERQKKMQRGVGFVAISFMILLYWASAGCVPANADDTKADDAYAADFVLKDLNGKDVRLSEYKGRPIFLIFMTTWCRDCFASIPTLKSIYNRYHEKGLVMLSIDVQEPHAKVAAYAKKHSLPYPVLLDPEGTLSRKYGVGGVPVKALIDRTGRIICWNCRSLEEQIEKQFEPAAK